MDFLYKLNPQQRRAVEAGDGPLLIMAGPGTGKTKTLTARMAYLVQAAHVPAANILALAFTNKAAQQMRRRAAAVLGKTKKPAILTFHALAHLLLELPKKSALVSDMERLALLQLLKKTKAGKGRSVRDLGLTISRAKNQLHGSNEHVEIVNAYNAELHGRDVYDYDDLLVWLHDALQRPDFRQKAQRFSHILVDEFQDTNELQYQILCGLNRTDNLFVIGDPLQSIYGFRGADSQVFERFKKDFAGAAQIELLTNYRSVSEIVRLSAAIFPKSAALQAYRQVGGRVQSVEVLNEYTEADWVINQIERQVGGSDMLRSSQHHAAAGQRTFGDFAILYRTHAIGRTMQASFEKSGIPYQVVGEGSPYLQPYATAIIQSFAYLAGLDQAPQLPGLKATQAARLLDPLKAAVWQTPLPRLAQQITSALKLAGSKNGSAVRQFTNTLVRYDDMPPDKYVKHVESLAEQEYYDPAAGAVALLTIHAAKGLEFPVVFLIAAEEGRLPFIRKDSAVDTEEERRLFYVAATRAGDELNLLHAKTRAGQPAQPSRFIKSLPVAVLPRTTDETMADQQRRLQKRQAKRRQATLFDV